MKVQALTIIVIVEENKPPIFSLSGELQPEVAYSVLFDILQQRARLEGKREKDTDKKGKASKSKAQGRTEDSSG